MQNCPSILEVWPVKLSINLKRKEILALECGGHQLPQKDQVSPHRLFGNTPPPADPSSELVLDFLVNYLEKRSLKIVCHTNKLPTTKPRQSIDFALALKACLKKLTVIPRVIAFFSLNTGIPSNVKQFRSPLAHSVIASD